MMIHATHALLFFLCTLLPSPTPQVQEAMLTGESVPVSKNLTPVPERSGLGDRKCLAYSATTVSAG
jgi:magnesium-transporting ATPase (P-type)